MRSRNPIRSETPPSGFPAALLCFNPLTVIRSKPSRAFCARPLPRTDFKLGLAPRDADSSEPMLRRIVFWIVEVSIPFLVGRDDLTSGSCLRPGVARRAVPLPRPLPLPMPIATSPSLSTRTGGALLRFCIPPLLECRPEVRRSDVRVARGPEGGVGVSSILVAFCEGNLSARNCYVWCVE